MKKNECVCVCVRYCQLGPRSLFFSVSRYYTSELTLAPSLVYQTNSMPIGQSAVREGGQARRRQTETERTTRPSETEQKQFTLGQIEPLFFCDITNTSTNLHFPRNRQKTHFRKIDVFLHRKYTLVFNLKNIQTSDMSSNGTYRHDSVIQYNSISRASSTMKTRIRRYRVDLISDLQ